MEKNKISLFTAIMMNVNIMVGAGIFAMPTLMTKKAGYSSFLGWPLLGLIFLPVVFCVSQITKYFPGKGSFYSYSKETINQDAGFISGWLYFLGYSSNAGIMTLALKNTLANQAKLSIVQENTILFCFVTIMFLSLLNTLHISTIGKIQNSITLFKLFPLFFVMLIMFFYWNPHLCITISDLINVPQTLPLTIFGFWGFEASTNISHLIENSEKNSSRAVIIGFVLVVITYALFHLGILHIMGPNNLINLEVPSFVQFLGLKSAFLLNLLNGIISAVIITAYLGAIFGVIISNSANLHSMVQHNLFPFSNYLKRTNKHQRPALCIWITGLIIFSLIFLINNMEILTAMGNIGILICFILTLVSLLIVQIKQRKRSHIISTILAFISCYIFVYYSFLIIGPNTTIRVLYTLPLAVLAIIGFIIYKFQAKLKL